MTSPDRAAIRLRHERHDHEQKWSGEHADAHADRGALLDALDAADAALAAERESNARLAAAIGELAPEWMALRPYIDGLLAMFEEMQRPSAENFVTCRVEFRKGGQEWQLTAQRRDGTTPLEKAEAELDAADERIRALLDRLPKCVGCPPPQPVDNGTPALTPCGKPATHHNVGFGGFACDAHRDAARAWAELPWAASVREVTP